MMWLMLRKLLINLTLIDMKLLTKKLELRFEQVGSQDKVEDPIIICKFFDPTGSWSWFAIEYDAKQGIFFGMVHGLEKELGCFSLFELEQLRFPFGLRIERDLHFEECSLSKLNYIT